MNTPQVGLLPAQLDLLVNQHATFDVEVTYSSAGMPQPLTDLTAVLSVAEKKGADPLFSLTPGSGLVLEPSGRTGVIAISMTAAQTSLIAKDCFYDCILATSNRSSVTRLFEGAVILDKGSAVAP